MSEENQNVVKKNVLKSYLAMARDCVGAQVWQHFYAAVDGEEIDVMYGGSNACAWFVSGVLVMQKLIKSSHATVTSTVKDMEETGFIKLTSPKPGSVILYAPKVFEDGSTHEHLAIYLGDDMAISTSFTKAAPILHDWRYRDHTERKITAIYYPTVWPK